MTPNAKLLWLVRKIKNRGRTLKEIQEAYEEDFQDKLPRRTFWSWKENIGDVFGIDIDFVRKGRECIYYISTDLDDFQNWILNSMSVNNELLENKSIRNRIMLENVPSSQKYLSLILKAMRESKVLEVAHKSFWNNGEEKTFHLEPYCVKMFRQRWYVVGKNDYGKPGDNIRIYGLDRIGGLSLTDQRFTYPDSFNPEKYFDGCIGVCFDGEITNVVLKVDVNQANYLRSLPLHSSQKEKERHDDYSIFTLRVRPSFDFVQELLHNRDTIEVLEPKELRDELAQIAKNIWEKNR